ncbi:MAG: AMP-binding protein, partial [Propionibacteriaceae bacterium]|nr:AMP-binding protein [Propionibacteriaceae bacterium]
RLGVKAGDRVAIILPNCPQHVVAFYAIVRLGAIVVEHNPLYTARELRHMFEDHSARVVISWDAAVEKLRSQPDDIELDAIIAVNLLEEFPTLKRLALYLPVPSLRATRAKLHTKVKGAMGWKDLLNNQGLAESHPKPTVSDIAAIQYTSGTTGQPKGAMLTHYNLYSNARQGEAWMHGARYRKENFYAVLPMFHAFGMTLFLTYGILKQGRLTLFPTFDLDLVLDAAKKNPPTVFCAVPPIYESTAKGAKAKGISLKSAEYCISGAMTLPDATVELWESVSGGLLVEGYGMTESSPVALGNPFCETRRTGTIGIPFPSTQMKVVDPENPTQEVKQGERGELLIKGPQVFKGYWNNPEETEQALLPGGWLRTGDVVVQDEDGFTTLVDRIKELIITGGFNVAPTEVELVLRTHPGVADVAVVGLPAAHSGEEVVAAIIPEPGDPLDPEEIRAFCRERLTPYKVPRKIVFVDSLPKSMLGKVLRSQVSAELLKKV